MPLHRDAPPPHLSERADDLTYRFTGLTGEPCSIELEEYVGENYDNTTIGTSGVHPTGAKILDEAPIFINLPLLRLNLVLAPVEPLVLRIHLVPHEPPGHRTECAPYRHAGTRIADLVSHNRPQPGA
jgi:hypothetical protein